MEPCYDQFRKALTPLLESALAGNNVSDEFGIIVQKLMPDNLKQGKFILLGKLIQAVATGYLPLTTSDYTSKDADLRRLRQGIRDIFETIDFILAQCAEKGKEAEDAVRETILNLEPRIKKMNQMKSKFVYVSLRKNLKISISKAKRLPSIIDDYFDNCDGTSFSNIEHEAAKTIAENKNSLLAHLLTKDHSPANGYSEHLERYSDPEILNIYTRLFRSLANSLERSGETRLNNLSSSLKAFLAQGFIHESYWKRMLRSHDKLLKSRKDQLEQWQENFGAHLPAPPTVSKAGFFDPLDWLEWNLSLSKGLPPLLTARKSMVLYNNLIIELLKKREEILKEAQTLSQDNQGLDKTFLAVDQLMTINIKSASLNIVRKICRPYDAIKDIWMPLAKKLHKTHQVLSILEHEITRVCRQIENMLEQSGHSPLFNVADQCETLMRRCYLGTQTNALDPTDYTPLFHRDNEMMACETISINLDKIASIFPRFEFDMQGFSFKDPISFKVADFNKDFSPKNIASKIRTLRNEFDEHSDLLKKVKILYAPGCGAGSYDAQSNTLLIPAFRHKTDFEANNFFTALADFLLKTRPNLNQEHYHELIEALKCITKLPPQLKARHHLHILAISTRELIKQNRDSKTFSVLKRHLEPIFHAQNHQSNEKNIDLEISKLVDCLCESPKRKVLKS